MLEQLCIKHCQLTIQQVSFFHATDVALLKRLSSAELGTTWLHYSLEKRLKAISHPTFWFLEFKGVFLPDWLPAKSTELNLPNNFIYRWRNISIYIYIYIYISKKENLMDRYYTIIIIFFSKSQKAAHLFRWLK